MIQLRPYQQEAVAAVYEHLRTRDDNPCLVLPTGSGKSLVLGQIAADAVTLWGGRVLVLAHVKELLEQNAAKIRALCPELKVGVYSAGLKSRDTAHPVIVAGIQSVYRRAAELDRFDLVLVDECHRISLGDDGEGMFRSFLADARIVNPMLRVIGLTATPYRLQGGPICGPENLLNHVCYEAGIREMIAQGYLCPLKSKAGKNKADTSGLHIRGGEFIADEVESLMDNDALVRSACTEIADLTRDRQAVLIFCAGVAHCHHVAAEIAAATGQECGIVTGDTPSGERDELLRRFRGETVRDELFDPKPPLKFLVNCQVLTHGFDAPNIDCVVLLRPTNSPGLYVQAVGRATRLHPGKTDALILDFGGNILRHGPVDALAIKDHAPGSGEAPAKECPQCQALIHAAYARCPECGFEFPPPRRGQHEGEASTAGILSGQVSETEYAVMGVYYSVHVKRDAPEDHPRTMRVDYKIGLSAYRSEWVCIEHSGYARAKAEAWWRARSREPFPESAERAVALCGAGGVADTLAITVRSVTGEKYERITHHRLGPVPPRLDGSEERDDGNLPEYLGPEDEDLPF